MRTITILLFLSLIPQVFGQQTITGRVSDARGNPVTNANIYIEGSYAGTTSDAEGMFSLEPDLEGEQLLVVSFVGYRTFTRLVDLNAEVSGMNIILEELVSELNEVVITAGVFSASDKKKSATLTSFDIASTASAMGDIYGAYATMPGSQKVGEEGLLFVRGGEGYETKTYMDGMLVQTPYFSSMPDIPTRGRFSPLLFSETFFSTGGYSAEFGNALSSIVDLTTNGLETENKASVGIMTVGATASLSRRWENTSVAMTGLYANNALHHKLFKQNVDWTRDPLLGDGMLMIRHKVGETGLLKSFVSYNYNSFRMNYDNFEAGTMDDIGMKDHTVYANTTYSDALNDKWLIRSGIAINRDDENITYVGQPIRTMNSAASMKVALTHLTTEKIKIRMGGDLHQEWYSQELRSDTVFRMELTDTQPSLFLESELKVTPKLALRLGIRTEYSSLLEEAALLPRVSAAYKTGKFSQFSLAWGKYRQKPQNDYLKIAPWLTTELADHYILNFQYRKYNRIFRVEAYLKQYENLVKYTDLYSVEPSNYNNNGQGYAGGMDLFWRDSKSIRGGDYWISYSFLNTSREYKDFPYSVSPSYASAHNLSVVYKQFITPLNIFAGFTYSFASARPFNDKNSPTFMDGRTRAYNDISMNITYLARLFKKDLVIHMNITNLPGFKNEFGYRYSNAPDENGLYASQPVLPTVGRQAVLVLLLSL